MTGYPSETALHRRYREAIRLPCSLCPAWRSLYQEMAAKSPNSGQSRICCRCRRTRCLLAPNGEMRTGDRRAPRLWKTKCYLANLPVEIDLWRLAATVKARWICGQARLQLKEKLGLDPFKGLSWHGTVLARSSPSRCYDDHCLHLLAALPCCQNGPEKRIDSPLEPQPAGAVRRRRALILRLSGSRYPYCRRRVSKKQRREQLCQARVSARHLYDRAGNGRSASSTRRHHAICLRPRAQKVCAGHQ